MPSSSNKPRELKRIKSSVTSRSFSLLKLGIGAGAKMAGRGIAQLWENEDLRNKQWKSFFASQAEKFAGEVGELKGSLMKAGQTLSVLGEHFFPPEVNQFLKTLQNDTPPVRWSEVLKTLKKELGAEKLAQLEIEETALASASLGQVHKARVKSSGEILCLKVQYPGVDKAVDSDLRALKAFLSFLNVLPKNFNTEPLFEEVRAMLKQETDYNLEAEWTEKYFAALKGDKRYVVPQVRREFSTRRVLATTFEEGVRPDDSAVAALSQDRRNRLGENFLEIYFREVYEWRFVQTDPHAGNYRIRINSDGQDQWVLLDFGATREYPRSFIEPYRHMLHACLLDDRAGFYKAAMELKFIEENDSPALKKSFEEFCFMVVEPFKNGVFDWKNTDLPQRTTQKAIEIIKGFSWRTPPTEVVFLDRKTGGVFIMLNILRAKFDGRPILTRFLKPS